MNKLETVFTDKNSEIIMKKPTKQVIKQLIQDSNHHTAPGSDGLTSYIYLKCFNIIGDTLVEVLQTIFDHEKPSISQRTCKMVFANKPGIPNSKKLTDKGKISFLNSDFKILTGLENK